MPKKREDRPAKAERPEDARDYPTVLPATWQSALRYAELGYPVIPVRPGDKKPAIRGWPQEATRDPEKIRDWADFFPDGNIGIATGDFFVIDVDGADNAWPRLPELLETPAPRVRTPGGGYHFYFKTPGGVEVRNCASKLFDKVDVRGQGGCVVAPPSIVDGRRYTFERDLVPVDELPLPPDWLIDALTGGGGETAVPEGAIRAGERNATLTKIGGKLRRAGLEFEEIAAALVAVNLNRCAPPLSENEVVSIARSVSKYPPSPVEKRDEILAIVEPELAELWHATDLDGTLKGFVTIESGSGRRHLAIGSPDFADFIRKLVFEKTRSAIGAPLLETVVKTLEARARFEGPQTAVFLRRAEHAGKFYIDLGDDTGRAVEISREGWRIIDVPPVRFIRRPGMLPLPEPERGGEIGTLRRFLPTSKGDFWLAVAWLLAALRPKGPYPVLAFSGPAGAGKTTACEILRAVVDPNVAPLRSVPKDARDLAIAGSNSALLAFDNLSFLKPWISDLLCSVATGAGFATRRLYSDADEVLLAVERPILLNGIPQLAEREDLADRTITLTLTPPRARRTHDEILREFRQVQSAIFGALLDLLSTAMREVDKVEADLPRMADFARWSIAALGEKFLARFDENQKNQKVEILANDPLACAIVELFRNNPDTSTFRGSATWWLDKFRASARDRFASPDFPKTASALGKRFDRLAPSLEKVYGIKAVKKRVGKTRYRQIELTKVGNLPSAAVRRPPSKKTPAAGGGESGWQILAKDGRAQQVFEKMKRLDSNIEPPDLADGN